MTYWLRIIAGTAIGVLALGFSCVVLALATAAHWIHPVSDEEEE